MGSWFEILAGPRFYDVDLQKETGNERKETVNKTRHGQRRHLWKDAMETYKLIQYCIDRFGWIFTVTRLILYFGHLFTMSVFLETTLTRRIYLDLLSLLVPEIKLKPKTIMLWMRQLIHAKHMYMNRGYSLLEMNWPSQLWSNLSSCKESPEKNQGFSNGIRTHDLRDTGPALYHWAMKPYGSKVKCEFNLYPSQDENETTYTR